MNKLFDDDPHKIADSLFAQHDANIQRGFNLVTLIAKFGIIIWLVGVAVSLTFIGVVGFVAWHFISKAW